MSRDIVKRIPIEFDKWIEERRRNLERVARKLGRKTRLSKQEVMRIISKTDGIEISDFLLGELKKGRRRRWED